ncbi:MAG: rane protein involved in colicin uptake [Candidatus Saccharibacteria bacterium]|nr:rane protein involved in colicin uptake [Candidatus Saccharibacteria bacterium]
MTQFIHGHEVQSADDRLIHRDSRITSSHYVHRSMTDVFGGLVTRVVYMASFVVTVLLSLRFLLSIVGANPANIIANFIYNASSALVTPFVGLFNYQPHYGISRFDFESLIALVAYGIIAWIVIALINTGTEDVTD